MPYEHKQVLRGERIVQHITEMLIRNILLYGKNELSFYEVRMHFGINSHLLYNHMNNKRELLEHAGIATKVINSNVSKKDKCFYFKSNEIIEKLNQILNEG